MDKLREYIQSNPLARLEVHSESWIAMIDKNEISFRLVVPIRVHELFWEVAVNKKKVFEGWSDYYEGKDNECEAEKERDSIKLLDALSKADSVRVETEGRILKTNKLMILRNGNWTDLCREIAD